MLWGCWQQVSQPHLHFDSGTKERALVSGSKKRIFDLQAASAVLPLWLQVCPAQVSMSPCHECRSNTRRSPSLLRQGRLYEPSLLFTIARAYGLPYLGLGFLKLASDILNFAGPLLLSLLIRYGALMWPGMFILQLLACLMISNSWHCRYLSSEEADPDYEGCRPEGSLAESGAACTGQKPVPNSGWLPATSSPLFGYLCAVALGLTSLLKVCAGSCPCKHFCMQVRSSMFSMQTASDLMSVLSGTANAICSQVQTSPHVKSDLLCAAGAGAPQLSLQLPAGPAVLQTTSSHHLHRLQEDAPGQRC